MSWRASWRRRCARAASRRCGCGWICTARSSSSSRRGCPVIRSRSSTLDERSLRSRAPGASGSLGAECGPRGGRVLPAALWRADDPAGRIVGPCTRPDGRYAHARAKSRSLQPEHGPREAAAGQGASRFSLAVVGMVRSLADFERFCGLLVLDNGKRMRLEDFQRVMLADYFAGCRETVAEIGKANGKTTELAALALFELITDAQCEGAVCAASRDQGALLLGQLRGFVERTPGLASRVRIMRREAVNRLTGGRFAVTASDVDTLDG